MSPPVDPAKKRSRFTEPTANDNNNNDNTDNANATTNDNEHDDLDPTDPTVIDADDHQTAANSSSTAAASLPPSLGSPLRPHKATSTASVAPPPSRRRVVRNLNFAGDSTPPTNNTDDTAASCTTPPPQLPASITTRTHSPHSPYRQPTLESHGTAPASLLDLFSPPAKVPPTSDDEVSGSLRQSQQSSSRRSLSRRTSSVGRLGAAETLSESTEVDRLGSLVDNADDDALSSSSEFATPVGPASTNTQDDNNAAAASITQTSDADTSAAQDDGVDDEGDFDPYLFIAQLPPVVVDESRPREPVLPPRKEGDVRPTLVLDLDETLVHCSIDALENADFHFPVVFNDVEYKVYVRRRPHFAKFLRDVIAFGFEIVVFTASQRVYADALLHLLDPTGELIEQRLFRDSCVQVAGNFIKDLSVLGRDLSRTAIIDNSPQTFGYQIDNGIPIESWFDDSADTELLQLLPLLSSLATCADVRPLLRDHFQLASIVETKRKQLSRSSITASQSTQPLNSSQATQQTQ